MTEVSVMEEDVEHILVFEDEGLDLIHRNFSPTTINWIFYGVTIGSIFVVNSLVLLILNLKDKKLIDNMVLVDSFANLAMISIFLLSFPVRMFENQWLCLGIGCIRAWVITLNRVIPLIVIVYRVMMVCHANFCRNYGEQNLRKRLLIALFVVPTLHTLGFLYYRNESRGFLMCTGREERLLYRFADEEDSVVDFYSDTFRRGVLVTLPWYHPWNIWHKFLWFAHWILVPSGYARIFFFLRKQNEKVAAMGSNENLATKRQKKNIVSIGFNLIAWMLDVLGDLIGLIIRSIDYHKHMCITLGMPNWLAPIVYLLGSGVFSEAIGGDNTKSNSSAASRKRSLQDQEDENNGSKCFSKIKISMG